MKGICADQIHTRTHTITTAEAAAVVVVIAAKIHSLAQLIQIVWFADTATHAQPNTPSAII